MKIIHFIQIIILISILYIFNITCYSQTSSDSTSSNEITNEQINIIDSVEIDTTFLKPKFGVYGHFNYNIHFAGFRKMPDVPCCSPKFNFGTGTGYEFGGLFEMPFNEKLSLSLRLGYSKLDALLKKDETTTGLVDGKDADVIFEHTIDTKLSLIEFFPSAKYNLWKSLSLYGGIKAGLLTEKKYSQKEEITSPSDRGVFLIEGTRIRNVYSGDIPAVNNLQFGLTAGVNYELPMNKNKSLILSPELFATYWLTHVANDLSWNMSSIGIGVSVKYKQPPPPPPPPPPPLPPPEAPMIFETPKSGPALSFDVTAQQVDSNNNEQKDFNIKIEDFITYNLRPLLNYIFFDENSSTIPMRYIKFTPLETQSFKMESLHTFEVIPTYYYVLNIIGLRLKQNPQAVITLVGTNTNTGSEKNNLSLSLARANTVRDYLRETWAIPDNQIKVESRNLPKEASDMDDPRGIEENRRVEILSNDPNILQPVYTIDTLRKLSTNHIRFYPTYSSSIGLKSFKLSVYQNNHDLISFDGKAEMPKYFDWDLSGKNNNIPKYGGNINFVLKGEDAFEKTASSPIKIINVEQLTIEKKRNELIADKEYEYYSLILFDFGKSKLLSEHNKVIDMIKARMTPQSTVVVYGYSDSIGDDDLNMKLSTSRAKEVARKLGVPLNQAIGVGEAELLYDNGLPEGRFYCRTVKITIETPINASK